MAVFGCIADDFTGASDAASFLVKGGMSVQLYNGVPEKAPAEGEGAQAMVIALKSRTQKTDEAVADSVAAARFLLDCGVKQIYFKYCSTFDSTPEGNIGPVADALMELTGAPYTILCPALPVNGRTVENGCLIVNGLHLHESHMKDHPLTPMWDSRIANLIAPQTKYSSREITCADIPSFLQEEHAPQPFYLIPDYVEPQDGETIAEAFWKLPLLTGGSGLLEPLARIWTRALGAEGGMPDSTTRGKALLVAGSCSKATLGQIAWYQAQGKPTIKMDPAAMMSGEQTVDSIWQFVQEHTTEEETVLVYSSDTPENVRKFQAMGTERVAAVLEGATAELAVRAVKAGYTRIISAGGETSGAVTQGLGFCAYWMGESVAPGVPIMVPVGSEEIRLILKSGNFGQEDFFGRALDMTKQ